MKNAFAALCFLLCLSACVSQPANTPPDAQSPALAAPAQEAPSASRNFEPDSLYQLLVAELAGQRHQFSLALAHYHQQTQTTASAKVAERAWQIADFLDQRPIALNSAQAWAKQAPKNAHAQRALALELARAQRFEESLQHMEQAIQLDPNSENQLDFITYAAHQADAEAQQALLQQFAQLQERHPDQEALPLAQAILLQDEQPQQALALLEAMPRSGSSLAALLLKARLYQQLEQPQQAVHSLRQALRLQPNHSEARLALARQLFALEQYQQARAEFLQLLQDEPQEDSHRLALAYLHMELGAWAEAEVYLHELIQRDSFTDTAYFNLGRCQEANQHSSAALASYQAVEPGRFYLAARQRIGELLIDNPDTRPFLEAFEQARQSSPEVADSLWQMEVGLLSQHQQQELAWQRVQIALLEMPGQHRLLYSRAMLAEQRNDLQQLERDLRSILHDNPEHAMALNALGYTLADRTQRYQEALELIEQAHQLQPEDAATMDSLGWVYFRLGQPETALPWLQQAYELYPDAEVAAHLGEVLWSLGQRRQARKLWRAAQKQNPEHPVLLDTLQRLIGN